MMGLAHAIPAVIIQAANGRHREHGGARDHHEVQVSDGAVSACTGGGTVRSICTGEDQSWDVQRGGSDG